MEVTSLQCYGDSTKGQCLTEIETGPPLAPNSTILTIKWEMVMVRCSKVFDIKHWGHLDHPFGSKHAIRTIQTNNHEKEKMETNYFTTIHGMQ
jgi:hypothetical protein